MARVYHGHASLVSEYLKLSIVLADGFYHLSAGYVDESELLQGTAALKA